MSVSGVSPPFTDRFHSHDGLVVDSSFDPPLILYTDVPDTGSIFTGKRKTISRKNVTKRDKTANPSDDCRYGRSTPHLVGSTVFSHISSRLESDPAIL